MSANTIPDDVMRAARAAFDAYANGAGRDVRDCIASAILAERQRCADATRDEAIEDDPDNDEDRAYNTALRHAIHRLADRILNPPSAASSRAEQTGEATVPPLASSPVTAHSDWITWNGGECPVDAGRETEVKFRDGSVDIDNMPEGWRWSHDAYPEDIIAYRVVQHD